MLFSLNFLYSNRFSVGFRPLKGECVQTKLIFFQVETVGIERARRGIVVDMGRKIGRSVPELLFPDGNIGLYRRKVAGFPFIVLYIHYMDESAELDVSDRLAGGFA